MTTEAIGERIRRARTKRSLGVNRLAEMAGVDRGNLSNYENGKLRPKIDTLRKLATAMEMPVSYFIDDEVSNIEPVTESLAEVPYLDKVAAGKNIGIQPVLRDAEMQCFELTEHPEHKEIYVLRVVGDSMTDAFQPGDLLFCEPGRKPRHQEYVIAVDAAGEGTFKQWWDLGHKANGKSVFELRALNPKYPPRRSDQEQIEVKAVVVSHQRPLVRRK